MKIIITGALGHIGSRLIRSIPLSFSGANIVMVDNLLTQRYCSLFNLPPQSQYTFLEEDILALNLEKLIEKSDAVVHLAAITDATASFQHKSQIEEVNYNGTVRVASACAKTQVPLIYISSTSIYGDQNGDVDETLSIESLTPLNPYAQSKQKEELFIRKIGSEKHLRYVICRFGTICGVSPGMRFHTAVNKFCWQASMNEPITIWKTAMMQTRPYADLTDAVGAMNFILKNKIFNQQTYNIVTENTTVETVLQHIKALMPDIKIVLISTQAMNEFSYRVSNKKFTKLGFQFKGSIVRCIQETMELLK